MELVQLYVLGQRTRAGRMFVRYEAVHRALERPVTLTLLTQAYARNDRIVARFHQEAAGAAQVHHPSVVSVQDYGTTADQYVFMVTEPSDGGDLRAALARVRRFAWPRVRTIMVQVCAAASALHQAGIVHLGIKPGACHHTLVGGTDRVRLGDLVVARLRDASCGDLSETGESNLGYMAPELASGAGPDPRVDVYALGALAYRMLAGRPPYTGAGVHEILSKHRTAAAPTLPADLALPAVLDDILAVALAKDPADRFESPAALANALGSVGAKGGCTAA